MSCITSLCSINGGVQQDSNACKAIACIPVVGLVVSLFQQVSLNKRIAQLNRPGLAAQLIEVKNKYKVCDIIRDTLGAVLIIASIAAGIFNIAYLPLAFVFLGAALWHAYGHSKNNELMDKIHSGRLPFGSHPIL